MARQQRKVIGPKRVLISSVMNEILIGGHVEVPIGWVRNLADSCTKIIILEKRYKINI